MAGRATKRCAKCSKRRSVSKFYKDKNSSDGLYLWCKICTAEYCHFRKTRKGKAIVAAKKVAKATQVEEDICFGREGNRFIVALIASCTAAKKGDYFLCSASSKELEAAFTGKCHRCGITEEKCGKDLYLDHDHNREELNFRGWLCEDCHAKDVLAVTEDK